VERFEKHLFVCTNERPEGHLRGSCSRCGGAEIKARLKACVKKSGLQHQIRVNSAGCLDACEFGAVLVVYPEGIWYGKVTPADVAELFQTHLLNNQPVERLKIPDAVLSELSEKSSLERFGIQIRDAASNSPEKPR